MSGKLDKAVWVAGGLMIACLLLGACCGPKDLAKEEPFILHDTIYIVKIQHDSSYIDRWHTLTVNGDTVHVHDSIYESHVEWKHDTLKVVEEKPVEVPVVKEVEKELSWLQRTFIYIGIAALAFVVIRLGWRVLKRYIRR